jgi:hypothetical protein
MKILFIYLSLAVIALSGCGEFQKKFGRDGEGTTEVRLRAEGPRGIRLQTLQGVMLYAVNADNTLARGARYFSSETAADVGWPIPNARYQFYAVGYSSANFGGTMYCGYTEAIPLAGGTIEVAITMDDGGICGTPPFSPSGFETDSSNPKPLYFGLCAASGGSMFGLTNSAVCDGSGGRPTSGTGGSMRVTLMEYSAFQGQTPSVNFANTQMSTNCVSGGFIGSGPVTTSRQLPYGAPFVARIESWAGGSCSSSFKGAQTLYYGIANADNLSHTQFVNSSGAIETPSVQSMKIYPGPSGNYLFVREF